MTARISVLDSHDPSAVRAYEQAFFAAFRRATSNRLVRKLWTWDMEAGRLATRIPYEDQLIYVLNGKACDVQAGIAANLAVRDFQSAAYGFAQPDSCDGVLEIITFFSLTPRDLRGKLLLWRSLVDDARARGFHTAYATTAERLVRFYRQFGWQPQSEAEIDSERRYFLRYDLTRGAATSTRP